MSREVGRIVIDLPVELGLEEARTGRYDRRAVAQRFRELEFRSLIDRLPPSSIAPTGYDSPETETKGGLQLSLDLLGGPRPSAEEAEQNRVSAPIRSRIPAARSSTSTRGSCGHAADFEELAPGSNAQGERVGLGWSVGAGRPSARRLFGIAMAAADGSAWYVTCDGE